MKPPIQMTPSADAAGEAAFAEAIELAVDPSRAALRLPILYRRLDAFCDEALRGAPIACKPGCSNCCRQWVPGVKAFEIEAIAREVLPSNAREAIIDALRDRVAAFDRLEGDRGVAYARLGLSCVFLTEDGTCGIRPIRPGTCRTFFSFGPPERCAGDPDATGFVLEPHPDFEGVLERAEPRGGAYTGELFRDLLARLS
jgi:Fe-S-cluster containining protein